MPPSQPATSTSARSLLSFRREASTPDRRARRNRSRTCSGSQSRGIPPAPLLSPTAGNQRKYFWLPCYRTVTGGPRRRVAGRASSKAPVSVSSSTCLSELSEHLSVVGCFLCLASIFGRALCAPSENGPIAFREERSAHSYRAQTC